MVSATAARGQGIVTRARRELYSCPARQSPSYRPALCGASRVQLIPKLLVLDSKGCPTRCQSDSMAAYREPAMPIPLRADLDAARLRGAARESKDAGQTGGSSRWLWSMMGQVAPRRPG